MSERRPPHSGNPLSPSNPLAPIYGCVFMYSAGEAMLHVLVPPYMALELGAGPGEVGTVLAVFAMASLVARFPVGAVYTMARARNLLAIGGGLSAAAFVVAPLIGRVVPFGVLMAVDGFGWSISTTVLMAALVAARPDGVSTAAAMGWYAGFTAFGHVVAGAVGGLIADRFGFAPAFVALAVIVAATTVVIVVALGRPRIHGLTSTVARERVRLREAVRHVAAMPAAVWAGVLVMVYINVVSGVFNSFHALLVLPAGLSLTQIGFLTTCRAWGSSTVRLGSGPVFRRTDGRWMTTPLVLLGAASLLLLPSVRSSFGLQIPLFIAAGVSRGLLRVTGSAEAFDGVGDDERTHGMTAALLHAGLDGGKLIGPLAGGVLAEAFGLAAMFRIVPLVLLAAYLPLDAAARRGWRGSVLGGRRGRRPPSPVTEDPAWEETP